MQLRRVGIVGVGIVPFENYDDVSSEDIARPAVVSALKDAGVM
jgi:acetyl-CoA acetyltransferase